MSNRTLTIEHNGVEYGGQVATIDSTSLGTTDHGVLTGWINTSWPGGGVGVGGLVLDKRRDREGRDHTRTGTAYGMDFILRVIETVGVDSWEGLKGQKVIVLFAGKSFLGSRSVGIAHATDESKVLIFAEHAAAWRDEIDGGENR